MGWGVPGPLRLRLVAALLTTFHLSLAGSTSAGAASGIPRRASRLDRYDSPRRTTATKHMCAHSARRRVITSRRSD